MRHILIAGNLDLTWLEEEMGDPVKFTGVFSMEYPEILRIIPAKYLSWILSETTPPTPYRYAHLCESTGYKPQVYYRKINDPRSGVKGRTIRKRLGL